MAYASMKVGFPFFTMLLFVFMGRYLGLNDPVYIVIGNILLMPINNGIMGVAMTISYERYFGALSYLLGSPAPRGPLFLGRAIFQILDGLLTVMVALPIAIWVFRMDVSVINLPLTIVSILLITLTTCGLGFLMGSISLVVRDGEMITMTLGLLFYVLVGVNFPVELLPRVIQAISFALPMTRGLQAARMALAGADWMAVSGLLIGEALIGAAYTIFGYSLFRLLERRSMVTGMLDNL